MLELAFFMAVVAYVVLIGWGGGGSDERSGASRAPSQWCGDDAMPRKNPLSNEHMSCVVELEDKHDVWPEMKLEMT